MEQAIRNIICREYTIKYPNDIILRDSNHSVLDLVYKYRLLQQRIGEAWEIAPTFYGWQKIYGIDLKNVSTHQAVELKNSYNTDNSSSRKTNYIKLMEFKEINPDYEIIYAVINDKTDKNKMVHDGRIRYVSGIHARQLLFGENTQRVINEMRLVVNDFLVQSGIEATECNET